MGFCHEPTPDMGRFEVETRRESFYLHIQDDSRPHPEFLYTDIPALRAALNQAAQDTEFAAPSVGELEWRERFMAFDVGCIECGEPSSILGLFATEAEAQAKCDEWDAKGWRGGQHYYEVFDLQRILSGAEEEG